MFKYRMYGSAVVSLPLIALIAMAISISVGTGVGEPSAYGVYGNWVIGGCVVALIAQLWGFLRALRRVRRAPEQPEVLLRALSRGPMLVWLYLLVLLVQYGWSRDMARDGGDCPGVCTTDAPGRAGQQTGPRDDRPLV
jgi:hypothetical protein